MAEANFTHGSAGRALAGGSSHQFLSHQDNPMHELAVCRVLAATACALLAAGCNDGYPTQDAVRIDTISASEHVRMLNGYVRDVDVSSTFVISLTADGCALAVSGSGQAGDIHLRTVQATFDTVPSSGRYLVIVTNSADDQDARSFAVTDWVAATAWRSHLQQLQRICLAGPGRSDLRTPRPEVDLDR